MATGPCATPPGPVSTTPPCATPTPPATGTTADSTPAAAGRASPATARAAKVKKKFDNKKNQSINQSIDSIPAPRDPVVKVVNHSLIQGSFILFFLGFFGGTGSRSKTRGQLFADQPRHVDPARPAVAQGSTGSGSSDLHPSVPGGRRWGSLASFWFLFGSPLRWLFFFLRSGIDIDCDQGRVYWSDVNGHSLRSARYDGSDHDVFLNTGQRCLGSTSLVVVVDVVVVVV